VQQYGRTLRLRLISKLGTMLQLTIGIGTVHMGIGLVAQKVISSDLEQDRIKFDA